MDFSRIFLCFSIVYRFTGIPYFSCPGDFSSALVSSSLIRDNVYVFKPVFPPIPNSQYGVEHSLTPACLDVVKLWNDTPHSEVQSWTVIPHSSLIEYCRYLPVSIISRYDLPTNVDVLQYVPRTSTLGYIVVFNNPSFGAICVQVVSLNATVIRYFRCVIPPDSAVVPVRSDNLISEVFHSLYHHIIALVEDVVSVVLRTIFRVLVGITHEIYSLVHSFVSGYLGEYVYLVFQYGLIEYFVLFLVAVHQQDYRLLALVLVGGSLLFRIKLNATAIIN